VSGARRAYALLAVTLAFMVVAGIVHYTVSDAAGAFAAAIPLVLVAPLIAVGTDNLQGRLSPSVVGIVQSAFGNVAELALTIVALTADLPDVVRIAIAGSILGNALLLGGFAAIMPTIRQRGRVFPALRFDQALFSGIATLVVIAGIPIGLLSFWTGDRLTPSDERSVSLVAGVVLLAVGVLFIYTELRRPQRLDVRGEEHEPPVLPVTAAYAFLGVGGLVAALTSDWFVAGFEPAVEKVGIPAAFAALVIVPLLGNIAENYVALRYAWRGQGDAAMSVIMHSVVQIATLMTGLLIVISQFVGSTPLTLRFDPVVALALVLSLVVLWMILQDGEISAVEAAGLLGVYVIVASAVWAEGSF
jgi:Ca2+:H+ antiporter